MDSFICAKNIVLSIVDFQANREKGFAGESVVVRSFVASLPDYFGYESAMAKIPPMVSGKLHAKSGAFIRPFMHRMLFYKRGMNWKTLHKSRYKSKIINTDEYSGCCRNKHIPQSDPLYGKTVICNGHKCGMKFYNVHTGEHEPCAHSEPHKASWGCSWEDCPYAEENISRECEVLNIPKIRISCDDTQS